MFKSLLGLRIGFYVEKTQDFTISFGVTTTSNFN